MHLLVEDLDLVKLDCLLTGLRRHIAVDQFFKYDRADDQDRDDNDHGNDASKFYAAAFR